MRHRWMGGALGALVWSASCVSILDVDADDHQDIDEVVCKCSEAPAACEGYIQALSERPRVERSVRECVEKSKDCEALDACFLSKGVCSEDDGPCMAEGQLELRCCDQASACVESRCQAAACPPFGASCAEQPNCCPGLECLSGSCCPAEGTGCATNSDCCGGLTCLNGVCQPCGKENQACTGDSPETTTCCGEKTCIELGSIGLGCSP